MPKLTVFLPNGTSQIFDFQDHCTIGRSAVNDLQIAQNCVSKNHCVIEKKGDAFVLTDVGSTNGTFHNTLRNEKPVSLQNGDEICFGEIKGIFTLDESSLKPLSNLVTIIDQNLSSCIKTRINIEVPRFLPEKEINTEAILRRDYEKLRISHELFLGVGHEMKLEKVLERILECCFNMLPADRGAIFIYDESKKLEPRAVRFRNPVSSQDFVISTSMLKIIETERVGILTFDTACDPRFNQAQSILSQGIRSSMGVPLLNNKSLIGIMFLDSLVSANAFSEKDLQILSNIANQAALMIANAELVKKNEEEAVARSRLQRFFSPTIAEMVACGKEEIKQGGEPRRTTVLFSDIRGFTSTSENMNAHEIVEMLNQYFEKMVDIIFKYGGTLDKFVGDEIMVLFGAPFSEKDDARRAVQAGIEMLEALEKMNVERAAQKGFPLSIGIGINTGDVVAGYIGSSKALQYTVIGAPVNLASRLCSRARDGNFLVISETTWDEVKDVFTAIELEPVPLKGISKPVRTYGITSIKGN